MTAKSVILTILGLFLVVLALGGAKGLQILALIEAGKNAVQPSVSISSTKVEKYQWESTLTAIGSLEAAKGLEITADLSGRITKILFDAGTEVSAGDLLVEQDTSTEKAQLRSAQSNVALEKNNFDRVKQLYSRKVASKSEYDSSQSAYQTALADADNIRASIEKKSIRAPFNGRLGIRLVNLGQSIDAGQPVVSLQSTDLMFVNLFLPQQNLPALKKELVVRLRSDAVPGKTFEGKINAINPEIDSETRSVEIQALLENPENQLLSGMFTNIEVVLPELDDVLIIPVTAVNHATYGDSVFVVEEKEAGDAVIDAPIKDTVVEESTTDLNDTTDNAQPEKQNVDTKAPLVVRQQFVRLGKRRGDYVVVTKGLSAGEEVASAGVFKLRNGAPVIINNDVVPELSLYPVVEDQ